MNEYAGKDEPLTILVGNNFGLVRLVSRFPVARLVHSASCRKESERSIIPWDREPWNTCQ